VEVKAIFGVEGLVERDIVVPSNDYFGLEISLFKPLYSFRKLQHSVSLSARRGRLYMSPGVTTYLREAALVCQITSMDEDITLGQFERLIVCV
jgi:hypothetical protein